MVAAIGYHSMKGNGGERRGFLGLARVDTEWAGIG